MILEVNDSKVERVVYMEVETVKLHQIVMKWFPDMLPFLNEDELNSKIILRDGLTILEPDDALEIIHFSICRHQSSSFLH